MLSVSIIYYNQGKTYTLAKQFDDATKSLEASLKIAIELEDEIVPHIFHFVQQVLHDFPTL